MFDRYDENSAVEEERFLSWRRIRIALLGSVGAVVVGLVLVSLFTWFQWGGTPFDRLFGRKKVSADVGKLAFAKGTDTFVGVVRGDGINTRRVKVYYIEQAGGQMIEVDRERVDVRAPAGR